MANSGQAGFSVGSEGGMDPQSNLNSLCPGMNSDAFWKMPFGSLSLSQILESLPSPTMGTQYTSQQHDQSAGTSSWVVHDQHLTNNNVPRSGTPETTPKKIVNPKKRETDRKYRERQKQKKTQMQNDLDRLNGENANLRKENALMNETLQSQAKIIDEMKSDHARLKADINEMQNAVKQRLPELSPEEKQMQNDLDKLNGENANLRKENALLNETLQSQAKIIDELKSDHAKFKSDFNEMQNAVEQCLPELSQREKQMQNDLDRLNGENANLRKENESLTREITSINESLQSQAKIIELKSDHAKLKSDRNEMQNAVEQCLLELLKMEDYKKLIKEGYSTQDPSPSDGKRHSKKDILAGTEHVVLDVDDSGDENDDSKRKKKRAAPSAPSGCRSAKVPKLEVMDELMETPLVTLAVKKECCDTRAEIHGFIHPPSVTECLRILKSMGGIQFSTLKKAKALFESPSEREFFVELTEEEWRMEWLKGLEKDA